MVDGLVPHREALHATFARRLVERARTDIVILAPGEDMRGYRQRHPRGRPSGRNAPLPPAAEAAHPVDA
jgi:hypothetical protein